MQDFKRLEVWRSGMDLVASVYTLTDSLPSEERFGLVSQMRSAAVSIVSNIAEGCGRSSQVELARFLGISFGSASELECQLLLVGRLGMIPSSEIDETTKSTRRIKRQLFRLRQQVLRRGRGLAPPATTDNRARTADHS